MLTLADRIPAQLLQRFSWKRLDNRRLQQELDTHRLLLLTEHYARYTKGMGPNFAFLQGLEEPPGVHACLDMTGAS